MTLVFIYFYHCRHVYASYILAAVLLMGYEAGGHLFTRYFFLKGVDNVGCIAHLFLGGRSLIDVRFE